MISASYQKVPALFAISLKPSKKGDNRRAFEETNNPLLNYEDVFFETLPKELPPERHV